MESTGGGYNLGMTHAAGAYNTAVLRAVNLCDSQRRDMYNPTLQLNQHRLARVLGYSPDDIVASLSGVTPQIDREVDQAKRQSVFTNAMKDGCPTSLTQYRAETQLDAPKDEADTLRGVGVPIPSSGAVVSATEASKGVVAPMPGGALSTTTSLPDPLAAPSVPDSDPGGGSDDVKPPTKKIELTATAQAAVIRVDEARADIGLPPWGDEDGRMSIGKFMATQGAAAPAAPV
jgi:hypothetical protein